MLPVRLPHPKYPLNKYSTEQLKAWVEECALFIAICDKQLEEAEPYSDYGIYQRATALWTLWDIEDVLIGRGISCAVINQLVNYARLDVMS